MRKEGGGEELLMAAGWRDSTRLAAETPRCGERQSDRGSVFVSFFLVFNEVQDESCRARVSVCVRNVLLGRLTEPVCPPARPLVPLSLLRPLPPSSPPASPNPPPHLPPAFLSLLLTIFFTLPLPLPSCLPLISFSHSYPSSEHSLFLLLLFLFLFHFHFLFFSTSSSCSLCLLS